MDSELVLDLELTRYEPPRVAESRTSTNGLNLVVSYALSPVGDGTRGIGNRGSLDGPLLGRRTVCTERNRDASHQHRREQQRAGVS